MNKVHVLFASSEVIPFAKTGGLGDVAGSLPKAISGLGADIRVVMPKYKCIPQQYKDSMEFLGYIYVDLSWRHQYCGILKLVQDEVTYYFLDNEYYFNRSELYGDYDEAEQFTFFSKAVLEMLPLIGFKPDVIHCNDWQTGIISLLLKANYKQAFYSKIKTVFTIHNLKYQGIFPKGVLSDLMSVDWQYFTSNGIEFNDCVNYMKAGLVYSDSISTVSPTYAREIKTDFYGEGLKDTLLQRSGDLYGILNGIDYQKNDPKTDSRIYTNFSADNISMKYENKKKLQEELGLPLRPEVPVIGIISRLTAQKGFDLIEYVLEEILRLDIQIVILGKGDEHYKYIFENAAHWHKDKVSANITFSDTLAQRIYAGSDMFLMPSLFEPCGLGQIFGFRYGSVPLVRETGGLNDTVLSYNEDTGAGNGFTFANYNAHDMLNTIRRAVDFYQNKKDIWKLIVERGMRTDFSWDKSAKEYMKMYQETIHKHG
ncbi:MAG: glycogen/starch synthase, ADP-glucose type [Eubacterium sp.]|jgi:starch synthase|nr:glycogen/starch synthase, ADP-glucose type [Eubacterium sp.]